MFESVCLCVRYMSVCECGLCMCVYCVSVYVCERVFVFVCVCVKIKKRLNGAVRFESQPLLGCVTLGKLFHLSVSLLSPLLMWGS